MGSLIEFDDTLQIAEEQGFPSDVLDLEKHRNNPISLEDVTDRIFEFSKKGARVYHPSCRCFLVQNIDGKWLYWGHIQMVEQTIRGESWKTPTTSGKYRIIKIYDPEYQEQATRAESPEGLSYF